ncbi:MAG: PqqD family protein [Candidatus Omnitrophota bacterium]
MMEMFVRQNQELAFRIIEDEAIILTPQDGMLHNLNPVATRIFELANGRRRIKDIVTSIVEEFAVKDDIARRDAIRFIEDLAHKKLLVLSSNPAS